MRNPFRDPVMRGHYEGAIRAFECGHLITQGGRRVRSNGFATAFWRGFDNARPEAWDAASRRLMTYAYWRAGWDVRAREPDPAKPLTYR